MDEARRGLDRSWVQPNIGVAGRYDAFCALGEEARAAWLAWAIARTIHAVPMKDSASGFVDHLGRKLEIDVAAWWRSEARRVGKEGVSNVRCRWSPLHKKTK